MRDREVAEEPRRQPSEVKGGGGLRPEVPGDIVGVVPLCGHEAFRIVAKVDEHAVQRSVEVGERAVLIEEDQRGGHAPIMPETCDDRSRAM